MKRWHILFPKAYLDTGFICMCLISITGDRHDLHLIRILIHFMQPPSKIAIRVDLEFIGLCFFFHTEPNICLLQQMALSVMNPFHTNGRRNIYFPLPFTQTLRLVVSVVDHFHTEILQIVVKIDVLFTSLFCTRNPEIIYYSDWCCK